MYENLTDDELLAVLKSNLRYRVEDTATGEEALYELRWAGNHITGIEGLT